MKQINYPTVDVQQGNWSILWSRLDKQFIGSKQRIRVPISCVLCEYITYRDASDIFNCVKIPKSCSRCQTKHASKIKHLASKGVEITITGCRILWQDVFSKRQSGENQLFVPVQCKCGVIYNAFVRFLHKRRHDGLCAKCANRVKALHGGKSTIQSRQKYQMTYVTVEHPYFEMRQIKTSTRSGYIPTHRLIVAEHLGRTLKSWEHVHHINQNKMDNNLENLQLVSPDKHCSITAMEIKIKKLEEAIIRLSTL